MCSFAACMVLITSTMTARTEVGTIPSSSACCMVSVRSSNAVDALIVCKQEALKRNSPMTSCRRAAELVPWRASLKLATRNPTSNSWGPHLKFLGSVCHMSHFAAGIGFSLRQRQA